MKFYLSYKQLDVPNIINKKSVYKDYYFKAFKTIWPFIGLLSLLLSLFIGKYVFILDGVYARGLLGVVGGVLYFHFHCVGIQKMVDKQSVFSKNEAD
ncbi:hypothetical protein [Catenovulum sediminis]|uniref:Uncharacterized protein n=1 Tax=Catenovulum sediminis TaxID=1740262 RepID=A0ABV1RN39_9ALTE